MYKYTILITIAILLGNNAHTLAQHRVVIPPPINLRIQEQDNLLKNPGFHLISSDGTSTGWKYNKIAVAVDNDPLKSDNKCLHILTDKPVYQASGKSYIVINYIDQISVKPDALYKLSFDFFTPRYGIGYPVLMYVKWFKQNGQPASVELYALEAPKMKNNKWVKEYGFATSPKDAVSAKVYLVVWGLGTEVYVDNVSFDQASLTYPKPEESYKFLKIMYCSNYPDKTEEARRVKDSGFDISYIYWKCYDPKRWKDLEHNLKLAKEIDLPVFVTLWLSEISPPEFRERHPLIDFNRNEHEKTPSIFHEEWWDLWAIPQIMNVVNVSQQYGIKGILIDFELYDKPNQVRDVCYCNKCLTKFSKAKHIIIPGKTITEKTKWLLDNGKLGQYREFQKKRLEVKLTKLRNQVDHINPSFQFGNLPYYDFLADRTFVERLGKETAPFIIAPEFTYGLQSENYSDSNGVDMAAGYLLAKSNMLRERGYHIITLGGVAPWTTIDFLEKKIRKITEAGTGGYWFFTRRHIDYELLPNYSDERRLTREEADKIWEILKIN